MRTDIASLRQLCHLLNRTVPPDAGRLRWSTIVALAEHHMLAGALGQALADEGTTVSPPAHIAERLRAANVTGAARSALMTHQLNQVLGGLNAAGIEPVLLKGGAALAEEQAGRRPARHRFMNDLDMLVSRHALEDSVVALQGIGYRLLPHPVERRAVEPHDLPMVRAGTLGPVELHVELGGFATVSVLPATVALESSVGRVVDGLRYRVLGPTERLVHHVLHAQVHDLNHRVLGLPVRQLWFFCLEVQAEPDADWSAVARRLAGGGHRTALACYVDLARTLFGLTAQADLAGGWPRARAAAVLRMAAIGWPADAVRNLLYAFSRENMEHRYGEGGPVHRGWARARHAAALIKTEGWSVTRQIGQPSV